MTLSEHVQNEIFLPRLKAHRVLVVYDASGRYREVCEQMASEQCALIDTTGHPFSSRLQAMTRWKEMLADTTFQSQVLIYCPEAPPKTDEERQRHPFASYAALGESFPAKPSDEYKEICMAFLPGRAVEIEQLFAQEAAPGFDLIDNLAGGTQSHPRLQSIFETADLSAIIPEFLVAESNSRKSLHEDEPAVAEMRGCLERTLGMPVNQQISNPATLRDKLWQYLLISEFLNDLPLNARETFEELPRAEGVQVSFARKLCRILRTTRHWREVYRERALKIEAQLGLETACEGMVELGSIDTFSFEEVRFLALAMRAVRAGAYEQAHAICDRHHNGLWAEEGERHLLWRILQEGLTTIKEIGRAREILKQIDGSGFALCKAYTNEFIKVEKAYRSLEEIAAQTITGYDEVEAIIEATRENYQNYFNNLQERLLKATEVEGWPLQSIAHNHTTFTDCVAPLLRDGKKVVYFLIDALRMDLAEDLCQQLNLGQIKSSFVCAQLPCVTRFGMAALLPEAENKLRFEKDGSSLEPYYAGSKCDTRTRRIDAIASYAGRDKVGSSNLKDFLTQVRTKKGRESFESKAKNMDLFVLTSTELDTQGEGHASAPMRFLSDIIQDLPVAITKLSTLGFDAAVIATDHGFVFYGDMETGHQCGEPAGEWNLKKRRCLIGSGDQGPGQTRFATSAISIPTDDPSFMVPRGLAMYQKGNGYFHEGLSLQESIVPRVVIHFPETAPARASKLEVALSCVKKTFSSRVISVTLTGPEMGDLFEEHPKIRLVAVQGREEVGRPYAGNGIDTSANLVSVAESPEKITLRLSEEAQEGTLYIKAVDPMTDKVLDSIELTYKPFV